MKRKPDTIELAGGRAIFIPTRGKRMTREQIAMALGSMPEDDPRWLAINQIIDEEFAAAVLDTTDPQLDASKGTYPGGKTAALAELKKRLVDLRQMPAAKPAMGARKGRRN